MPRLHTLLLALVSFAIAIARGAEPSAVRVVSQTVGTDELLLALAEPSQIAALSPLAHESQFCAVSDEAAAYPQLAKNGDAENALKFSPTLILVANYSRVELVSQVRRAGVKVFVV